MGNKIKSAIELVNANHSIQVIDNKIKQLSGYASYLVSSDSIQMIEMVLEDVLIGFPPPVITPIRPQQQDPSMIKDIGYMKIYPNGINMSDIQSYMTTYPKVIMLRIIDFTIKEMKREQRKFRGIIKKSS